MDIVFLILKILFILLQVCLVLIILAVLTILFTKLKYQLKVNTVYKSIEDKNGETDLNIIFRATYLFSIIKLFVDRKDEKVKILLKVFGKDVFKTKVDSKFLKETLDEAEDEKLKEYKKAKDFVEENLDVEDDNGIKDNIEDEIIDDIDKIDELDEKLKQENPKNEKNKNSQKKSQEEIEGENEVKQAKGFFKSMMEAREIRLANKVKKLEGKEIEKANEFAEYIKKYVKKVSNIKKLFHATLQAIKNISPKKFILRLTIGYADPSKTGQLIGLLYMIKGITNLDIVVNGEFEKEIKPDIFCYSNGSFSVYNIIKPFKFFIVDVSKKFISIKYNNVIKKVKKLLTKLKKDKGE